MTKTYSATLAATELLLIELLGDEAGDALTARARAPPRTQPTPRSPPPSRWSSRSPTGLRDVRHLFVTGGGLGYPAALEAALKLKEMALVHAEGAEAWEMTSGAATMLGPDAVVIALAPAGPAAGGPRRAADPRRGLGRAHDRGGAASGSVEGSALLPLPADAAEDHAPLSAVPPVALLAVRARPCARRQSRPPRLDRAVPQPGAPAHPRCRDGGAGMTRIVLVGAGSVEFTRNLLGDILSLRRAARRRDRPPRHRPRPAARPPSGWPPGRPGRWARRRRSAAASTGARR